MEIVIEAEVVEGDINFWLTFIKRTGNGPLFFNFGLPIILIYHLSF